MLTLQSRVGLNDLTTFGALKLATRAWGTLRAVAQGATHPRAVAPIRRAAVRGSESKVDQNMPRIMLRGAERC